MLRPVLSPAGIDESDKAYGLALQFQGNRKQGLDAVLAYVGGIQGGLGGKLFQVIDINAGI